MVRDMTQGRPGSVLIRFTLPMIAGNLFQQLYNIVDSVVVGNFVGAEALAAVGASASVVFLFLAIAVGGSIGASVIIGQLFGAQELRQMKTAVYTALITMLFMALALTVVGLIINEPLLRLLNTPEDVIGDAATYLGIYFMGLTFLFIFNICNSIFNALGDSRTPLYFLIFSSLFNIALDLLFVIQFEMGVAGVAWATLIAQGVSAVLAVTTLLRRMRAMDVGGPVARYDRKLLTKMSRVALPSMLQQSIVSLGMVFIQSAVNSFGTVVLAGYTAASKIEQIATMPMVNIGNAMGSFVAQNIGARKSERIGGGLKGALGLVLVFAVVLTAAMFLWGDVFVSAFLDSDANVEIIEFGASYLQVISIFFFLFGLMNVFFGVLKGAGDMSVFMTATLTNFVLRVVAVYALADIVGPMILCWACPIGWSVGTVIGLIRYFTGGWKKKALV